MQASYISSSLACVSEVSVVKGGRWKKKSEAGRAKRARRLRREKKCVCADSSLPALKDTVIEQTSLLNLQRERVKITLLSQMS